MRRGLLQTLGGLCFPLLHPVSVFLCGPELQVIPKQSALIQRTRGHSPARALLVWSVRHTLHNTLCTHKDTQPCPLVSFDGVWYRSVWSDADLSLGAGMVMKKCFI